MPGVIKKLPPIPDEAWIRELRVRGHCKKLPGSRSVLQALVEALLTRISIIKDETEEKWLRREIEGLAGLEDLCNSLERSSETEKARALAAWLLKIERSEIRRDRMQAHDPSVLRIQRRMLNEIILESRYLNLADPDRKKWLRGHWMGMMSTLHGVPCRCDYDVDDLIQELPEEATLTELVASKSGAGIQKTILAKLHQINLRQVEKLLAPSSK